MCPVAHSDGHDLPRSIDKVVPGVTAERIDSSHAASAYKPLSSRLPYERGRPNFFSRQPAILGWLNGRDMSLNAFRRAEL